MPAVLRKVQLFAACVEIGTGFALLFVPTVVTTLLLGAGQSGEGSTALARFLGIALLALGVACWPARVSTVRVPAAVWGMLIYNLLVAVFLATLFLVMNIGGVLLWPGVLLHAAVAVAIIWNMNKIS